MSDQLRTIEQFERENPLWRFSPYLFGRINVLRDTRMEILRNLDGAFEEVFDFNALARAERLAWLWTLGAYEVVRTMCQARTCFSTRTQESLRDLKRQLGGVRMPAAKMEYPGKQIPITSARGPAGIDANSKDILLGAPGQEVSARQLLAAFAGVISAIGPEDVLESHEASYEHAK